MIAVDSSTFIASINGLRGADVDLLGKVLRDRSLVMPPPVLAEVLSAPNADAKLEAVLKDIDRLTLSPGYWERAGRSRGMVLAKGLKAKLADALIAQCCIDADVPLITRDGDYRHFAKWCGLKLAL